MSLSGTHSKSSRGAISYRLVRRQHCTGALSTFLRRWGVFLTIGILLAGPGAPALAAGTVLPLFWSLSHPASMLAAVMVYALLIALLLGSASHLLWPVAWAQIERTLPIPPRQILLADLEMLLLALMPLGVLMTAGAALLLWQTPDWLRPVAAMAPISLGAVMLGSVGLAMTGLQHWRRKASGRKGSQNPAPASALVARVRHWAWVLLWAPLRRGVAPRTARAVLLGGAALLVVALLPTLSAVPVTQSLMLFSALAWTVVIRVDALARQELEPLHRECRMLALNGRALQGARAALALVPALCGLTLALLPLLWAPVRPLILLLFIGVTLTAWGIQLGSANADATTQSTRWVLSVALSVALASEVVP